LQEIIKTQKATLSKIIRNGIFLKKYLKYNKLLSIIVTYFIVSILIKIVFSLDILIPCLWKTTFHIECYGCGLTRAFIEILHCNFTDAFDHNPLIFIVLPLGMIYLYYDFMKFLEQVK